MVWGQNKEEYKWLLAQILTRSKAERGMCWGTGGGAAWAQQSFQQVCWSFCTPPSGFAPAPPDGSTSLWEWRANLHSPWQRVQAEKKTASSFCGKRMREVLYHASNLCKIMVNPVIFLTSTVWSIFTINRMLKQPIASTQNLLLHFFLPFSSHSKVLCNVSWRAEAEMCYSLNKVLYTQCEFWPPFFNYYHTYWHELS